MASTLTTSLFHTASQSAVGDAALTDRQEETPDASDASGVSSLVQAHGAKAADAPIHLDEGWQRGSDGMRSRRAARVLILDERGRVLVVRGHDADEPERHWWFTVGGGIDPGESPEQAACREVFEETGLRISPQDLEGPVLERSAIFDFAREHCRQEESFFCVRVPSDSALSSAGWTELEMNFIDELAWMSVAELEAATEEIFPRQLPQLVASLHPAWDGSVRRIGIDHD